MTRVLIVSKLLFLLSPLRINTAAAVINDDAEAAISNPLVDYKQCSSGDKQWRICQMEGQVDLFCPTVPSVNFSQVIDGLAYEGSDYSFSDLTTNCFKCSNVDDTGCETFVAGFLEINIKDNSTNFFDQLLEYCQLLCEGDGDGEECSLNDPCTPGAYFCDYNSNDDFDLNIPGICKPCPSDLEECYGDGFVTSTQGKLNCHHCRIQCHSFFEKATVTINGEEYEVNAGQKAIQKSIQNVSAPLIDCSNLLLVNEFDCPGAKDHMCIFDMSANDGKSNADDRNMREVYMVSIKNGCVAMVLSGSGSFNFNYGQSPLIPFVKIQMDANDTLQFVPEDVAQLKIQVMGTRCTLEPFQTECNNRGLGCRNNHYCEFNSFIDGGEYTEGSCVECPAFENGKPNPAACFFAQGQDSGNHWSYYRPEIVESCATSCHASLGKILKILQCNITPFPF